MDTPWSIYRVFMVHFFILFIYLLINIKIDKSVIPHQCISVINEADIVLNKKEIIKKIKIKIKINEKNKIKNF